MRAPLIILCIGYPSTGKSTSTQRLQFDLSRTRNVDLLTTMSVRKSLGLLNNLYEESDRDRVYDEIVRLTAERLAQGSDIVILDGNFNKRKRREPIYALARRYGAELIVIECCVESLSEINERMNYRKNNPEPIANRASSLDLYHLIKEAADHVEEDLLPDGRRVPILRFDTEAQKVSSINVDSGGTSPILEEIRSCLMGKSLCEDRDRIRAVIFDIGGVLQGLRWESVSNMLLDLKPDLGMDEFRNALYCEKERYFGLYEVSRLGPDEFWGVIARRLDLPPESIPRIREAFGNLYGPVDADLDRLIERLHTSCRLFILSNSCPELEESINKQGDFYRRFEKIYFSHHIGFKKPGLECFQWLLKENGLQPGESLFIDDVAQNVRAAETVGMKGLLFLSPSRLKKSLSACLQGIL